MKRHHKIRAVLTAKGFLAQGFTGDQVTWLRSQGILPPMAGADDGDGDGDGDEEDDNEDEVKKKDKKEEDSSKEGKDDSEKEGKDGDDDDTVSVSKNEIHRLRRKAREADEKEKKAKRDQDESDKKKKREEGRYQELLDEEKTKTVQETERADKAENELKSYRFQVAVNKVATRVGFRDPSDAHLFLSQEMEDADEKDLERALKKVLEGKTYLKAERSASGTAGNGNGGGTGLTMDDVRRMTPDQVNARWDDVQKVMQKVKA